MKRCPKCNRAYATDTQKFCTHDGGLLFMVDESLTETVQFDSAKVRDKVSHPTTRDLDEQKPSAFDPEATVVTPAPVQGAQPPRARDTGSLEPPQQTQYYGAPPSAPATGPVSQPTAPTMVSSVPPPASPPQPPPTSGPIAQPPGPPASAQTPSGPIAAPSGAIPAPAAQAAVVSAQPSQPLTAAPPKKKSKLPLILGIVAVVLVLFVGGAAAAGYFLVIKPRQEAKAAQRAAATEPAQTAPAPSLTTATPAEAPSPANEPPPYNPPADAVQFVNSKDELSGKLAENFVAFSFYYPNRWIKVPGTENFVKVERRLPPDFTQENFAVAPWYAPAGVTSFDNAFFQTLVAKDDADFAKKLPEYRKVSEGSTKIGTYDAYEFRFEGVSRGTDKGDLTLWGREIFFAPREGENAGIKFLILTTSLAPELKSIDDVGLKGELPMILESFRFGK